jgi:exopolysaccharide biosynthesis polyprenyl glycosylphosphotransferase
VLCGLGAGFAAFAFKLTSISRLFTFYFFFLAFLFLVGKQISVISCLHYFRKKGYNAREVLIYGHGEEAARFAKKVEEVQDTGYRVVRILTDKELRSRERAHPLTALRMVSSEIDEVFFVLSGRGMSGLEQILALLLLKQGKRVHLVPSLFDMGLFRQSVTDFAGIPVLSLGGTGLDEVQALGKRVLDVLGAVGLSVLLCPVFVLVAVLVKLLSPGPVLFVQERLGKTGKRFQLYKFRTMRADAEHLLRSNPQLYEQYVANNYKLMETEDPRITPIGRFLRKTSLDELPQLFNVLKGDMSLVGPRPIVPPEIEKYGDYAPLLLSVKPGLTGYWQVNGRSSVDYPLRAELDLEYVRDQSFKMDMDILLKTIPAVMRRKGAY